MSWFSDWLHGNRSDPLEAERLRIAEENRRTAEARALADQQEAEAAARMQALREAATGSARTAAGRYFTDRGFDLGQFAPDIESEIARVTSSTAEDDPNIGSYLSDLGERVYQNRTNALRERSGRDVNALFAPDFELSRIAGTADDDILAGINTRERGEAESFVDNLLRRGVISNVGKQAALRSLDDQGARVRSTLEDLGGGVLEQGRQGLRDIAGRARERAATVGLGEDFDVGNFGAQADTSVGDFTSRLGDRINALLPDNLYDTSGLAAIAGGAQGAGNTRFDPNALAGIIEEESPDEEEQPRRRRQLF